MSSDSEYQHASFKGVPFLVAPSPDRTTFVRDAEAATRLGNPWATRAFLIHLCRTQARRELYQDRSLTQADRDHLHRSRTEELYGICEAMGYTWPRLVNIEVRQTFRGLPKSD